MGSYLDICCERKTQTPIRYIETTQETLAEQEIQKEQSMILNAKSRLPPTVMQMKIKTKNLIQKRTDSPYDHYIIEKNLGSGSFGNVYKVTHRNSHSIRALKQIPKIYMTDGVSSNQISNEIQILRLLDHPNIMKIYEFYEDNDNFYILSEYCDQGDLKSKCEKHGTFSEFNVKFFMYQIFNAIAYLHQHQVIHGDIKLENILLYANFRKSTKILRQFSALNFESKRSSVINELKGEQEDEPVINNTFPYPKKALTSRTERYLKDLSNYEIKLIDFGCSKIFTRKKLKGIIGTSIYCSPEVIDNEFNEKCDEWSCGILMYFLLAGEPPFYAETEEELFNKIKNDELEFPKKKFNKISKECQDLIRKLLTKNVNERITAVDALKEPFFMNNIDFIDNTEAALNEKEVRDTLNELKNFHKSKSKFQEMVLAYIALNYLDKDEEIKIKKIFRAINKDHTKYQISREEFTNFCREFYSNEDLSEVDTDELFDLIDSDKSGSIEYQELIRAMSDKEKLLNDENLKAAFDFFDVGKSGLITWDEINKVIFDGRVVDDSLMNEYLGQIGKKKDDTINFMEFCDLVK